MSKISRNRKTTGKPHVKPNFKAKAIKEAGRGNYQDAFADKEREKGEDGKKFPVGKAKYYSNDAQWYFKSSNTLQDVASYAFQFPLGAPLPATPKIGEFIDSSYKTIPGIMALYLVPTIGIANGANSPINLAAQNVYSRVRYRNSGKSNYDPQDLMLYYVAMSSLYSFWNWLKRIYGYAFSYSQNNWYKAKGYAALENIDLDDVVSNLSNFRAQLNIAAGQISAFAVPAIFNYMVRESWLYSNIYKDSDTHKAQEYFYSPVCFYKYDEMSSPQGGILVPVDIRLTDHPTKFKTSQLLAMLKDMIDALQYSSDIGDMSGDTIKEFGGNLIIISTVDADYRVEAVYNKEVLTQFENTMWMPHWYGSNSPRTQAESNQVWTIRQNPNTNFITFQPKFVTADAGERQQSRQLNFHWDSPTPEDVIVASRINVDWTITYEDGVRYCTVQDCGSEICLGAAVVVRSTDPDPSVAYTKGKPLSYQLIKLSSISLGSQHTVTEADEMYKTAKSNALALYAWTAFDWAPALYFYYAIKDTSTKSKFVQLPDLRDWDVFTSISAENDAAMNLLAVQSLFDVPFTD